MSLAANAARMIARKGKTITLTRPTRDAGGVPWEQAAVLATDVYEFKAKIIGAAAQYVDGSVVLASDLMVIARAKARHTLTNVEPADGAVVDLAPEMTDVLQIDGADKVIKKIVVAHEAGAVALYRLFVAS
jgi:hypothetical protein